MHNCYHFCMENQSEPEDQFTSNNSKDFESALNELTERQASPEKPAQPHIFLEVGIGPWPSVPRTSREFKGLDKYVGVELHDISYSSLDNFQNARDNVEASGREDENIAFVNADGTNLPFADDVVHEVLMSDLLNSDLDRQNKRPGQERTEIIASVRNTLITEAYRVLEPNGTLVLRNESMTDDWTISIMRDLEAHGFMVEKRVDKDSGSLDSEFKKLEQIYGKQPLIASYMIARKRDDIQIGEPERTPQKKRWFRR